MRLQSFTSAFALAVATISLCVPSAALAQQPQQTYTGRQIFEGAFFGVGPLAAARPVLRGLLVPSARKIAGGAPALRALEKGVQRIDPSYFQEIGPQMTSGDPGVVQAAVTRTAADLARATASSRAHEIAIHPMPYPVTETFIVLQAEIVFIAINDYTQVLNHSLGSANHYQTEQAIAALTTQLANVTAAS